MIAASGTPARRPWSGRIPCTSARLISASLQLPIPVSISGVMFGAVAMKAGVVKVRPPENAFSAMVLLSASRGVAIAAGHDGVDEIAATLGRGFSHCAACGQQQYASNADPKHDAPLIHEALYCMRSQCRKG